MPNRKFNLTCAIILLNFFLFIASKIDSTQWMTLCMAVLTIYVVGNVASKTRGE